MPTIDNFVNAVDDTLTQRGYLIMSLGCEVLEDKRKTMEPDLLIKISEYTKNYTKNSLTLDSLQK